MMEPMESGRTKGAGRVGSKRRKRVAPRREAGSERSQELLDVVLVAATELLGTEGWDRFTMNAVARRAGVSVGFVYRYFPNRDALGRTVALRQWEVELAALSAVVAGPGAGLRDVARAYVTHIAQNPRLHAETSLHLVHLVAEDARTWDAQVIAALESVFTREFEDHPRRAVVCENLYTLGVHIARRAALLSPDALASGKVADEVVRIVDGYVRDFTPRAQPRDTPHSE